jgi:hypothetical protein
MSDDDDGPVASNEPTDRLTRLCDAMTKAFMAHPEYNAETDRCIILIDDDDAGGLVIHGYDPEHAETDAVIALFEHLRAIVRASGSGDVEFIMVPQSPEGID